MRADGTHTHDKVFCHLCIGQACCHQPQDLNFAGCQSCGICRGTLCLESGLHGKRLVCRKRLGGRHGASICQSPGEGCFSQVGTSRGSRAFKESLWNVNIEGFRKVLRCSPQQGRPGGVSLCGSHAAQSFQPGSDSTSCPQLESERQAIVILGMGERVIVLCQSQARQHQTGAHHVVPVPHLLRKLDALVEERLCPLHLSLQEGNLPHHIERESNLPLRAHYSNKGLHFLYEDTCLRELPLPEPGARQKVQEHGGKRNTASCFVECQALLEQPDGSLVFSLEHRQDAQMHEHKGHCLRLSMGSRLRERRLEARSGFCIITDVHQSHTLQDKGVDQILSIFQLPRECQGFFSHWCELMEVPLIPHQLPLSDERFQTQGSRCCLLPGQTPLQKAASLARIPACDP